MNNTNQYVKKWLNEVSHHEDEMFTLSNITIQANNEVFLPKFSFSTQIIVEHISNNIAGKKVLDMGTGSGILAFIAEQKGAKVLAVDNDMNAIKNAKQNRIKIKSNIEIKHSDLFSEVSGKYDLILANLPILYTDKNQNIVASFIKNVKQHVNKNGKILLSHGSFGDFTSIERLLEDCTLKYETFSKIKHEVEWRLYSISL